MEYVVDRKWRWVECNLVIKRLPQKQYQQGLYQSLQAEVELMSEEPDIKNFDSQIIMQKAFQFEEGRGFIWHKSWYIPEIVLKLSSKITKMLKQENHIKKIYCQMLSGYPFKKDEHFYIEQVKLDGETLKQFSKKGEVIFSNIKFSETSFNKNKNKFSIILVLYTTDKQNQRSIIKSYISSPIHVDSRKEARKKISANTFIQDQININKFTNKLQGSEKLINENCSYEDLLTIYGFIKYYTAANIRFKIKHPYYLGYHFQSVFDIYYNSEEANDPSQVLDIIYENQIKQSDKPKQKSKDKKDFFTDNKQILKKTCPKILLFMIKNTPKQCFLIKDQIFQSEEKLNPSEQKLQRQNEQHVKKEQIQPIEKLQNKKQKTPSQQENEILLRNSGLTHILQPHIQNHSGSLNQIIVDDSGKLIQNEDEEDRQENDDQNQKVKEEDDSELEFPSKKFKNQQNDRKQQLRAELLKEEEAIKKIFSIFQSWKFNFVHLKKSDGGMTILNKKWIYIPPEELLESFKIYTKKKSQNKPELNRVSNEGQSMQINGNNVNSYLSYDIHQVIELQRSKHVVKIEDNYYNGSG